jgi:hypothetical protein
MVIEFVQIAVNSRLPPARGRVMRARTLYALISNPFILKRNAPFVDVCASRGAQLHIKMHLEGKTIFITLF